MALPSLDDERDRDLVRRVAGRDEEAFLALFRRYGPTAKALAGRILREPSLAEDVVQEAFLGLWRDPASYREHRGTFRSWLMSTVHHRSVDRVRREEAQRRRMRALGADGTGTRGETVDVAETVIEELAGREMRATVRAALEEIPREQREILELMYFRAKSQSTISAELRLPLGTVKSRALLGMRRLRSLLLERSG